MKPAVAIAACTALLLGLAGGGFWLWSRSSADGTADAAGPARVVSPQRRTVESTVIATGALRLAVGAEVRVGAQVSGIVQELNVSVGSQVRKGDVLARIDSRGLRSRLAQSQAQVAIVEREVQRARIEQARVEGLLARELVARSVVEDRRLALAEAEARLEKARRDVAVVETELSYTEIRAPIAGTVASVTTQQGETVAASFTTPTFVTIIDNTALQLVALVDETDIGGVALGNPVSFTVEAHPQAEFAATVERIAPRGTVISGVVNYEVICGITGPLDLLKPDMTANVSIRTARREALVLPNDAVQRDGTERFVWLEQEGGPVRREVTVGTRAGGMTEIRRGLTAADRVLVGAPAQL